MPTPASPGPGPISRDDFDEFLRVFTHEIRNRLNAIGLEAADLAEQVDGAADATRLLAQVRDCAALLKTARDLVTPDDPAAERLTVAQVIAKLQAKK
jgi:signal transduction histidine kinase